MVIFTYFTSLIEPKNTKEALLSELWVKTIQEKLE